MDRIEGVRIDDPSAAPGRWALGGLIGAVLASACCIGPLALVALGVSGAWVGALTRLEPLQPLFALGALACIGLGFRAARRSAASCAPGSACARPGMHRATVVALWAAAVLVVVAVTVEFWAALLA